MSIVLLPKELLINVNCVSFPNCIPTVEFLIILSLNVKLLPVNAAEPRSLRNEKSNPNVALKILLLTIEIPF